MQVGARPVTFLQCTKQQIYKFIVGIHKDAPIPLPPRIIDLTPLDFFFSGCVKRNSPFFLYAEFDVFARANFDSHHDLVQEMVQLEYRFNVCRATYGAHNETC